LPTLKDILDAELSGYPTGALRLSELTAEVQEFYLTSGAPCTTHSELFKDWPGSDQSVKRWYVLDNGAAIGLKGSIDAPDGIARHSYKKVGHLDWNRLRNCRIVHQVGSFTKAGEILEITQSAVSRQISALEIELGFQVFIRNREGLIATEAGEGLLEAIDQMWESLELGLARSNELNEIPDGPLKLTTTEGFGAAWLSSRLVKFKRKFPNIDVTLLLADNIELDLRHREADCAIRFQHPTEPNLIRKLICEYSYRIYASERYLERHGTPESLQDLDKHRLIVYGSGLGHPPIERMNWLLAEGMPPGERRKPDAEINSVYGVYRATENGLGIAALPFYFSERSEQLVEILPQVKGPPIPVFFVYPEELSPSRRIALLRDFIIDEIRANWNDHKLSK
jgi:DNA-binding transcriptional LysR family regulator